MLDRILKNWKTTMAAVIPAIGATIGWLGFSVDLDKVGLIAAAVYAILFLLSKDQPPK